MNISHEKEIKSNIPKDLFFFSFQRFHRIINNKNYRYTLFDNIFDMKDFTLNSQNLKYRLFSTINHSCFINKGNYYAYININNS